jgi:uncharacterized protein (UPF0218 family)
MKRDWNIIRRILQLVEVAPPGGTYFYLDHGETELNNGSTLYRQARLIGEGDLATTFVFEYCATDIIRIVDLTDKGRTFLARSRNESAWAQAMAVDSDYGGISFEILELLLDKYQQEIAPKTQRNLHNL